MRTAVDGPYHMAATTASSTLPITGSPTIQTSRYHIVNGGAQEVLVVLSRTPGPVASFPADSTKSALVGYVLPANDFLEVFGPPCGQGKTAYAAVIASTGTTDVYITPVTSN